MNFYKKINNIYSKCEEYEKEMVLNSFNKHRYMCFKLVLMMLYQKTDEEFIIFYNKNFSDFKFKQKYYNKGYVYFDTFIGANDFIEKITSLYINDENFYIEINRFILFNRLI
jgi:hypothetical protein